MDENLQSFSLLGRIYYLDTQMMDMIQYSESYNVSVDLSAKALGLNVNMYDWDKPEVDLYKEYLRRKGNLNPDEERRIIKSKLWQLIDSSGIRPIDIMKACEMLLSLSVTLPENQVDLKNLSYGQLIDLLDKLKQ